MTTDDLIDRWQSPLYTGTLPDASCTGAGRNESCGDIVAFDFKIEGGIIVACRHTCKACVLTSAMADLFAEALEGQTPNFVRTLDPFKIIGIPIGPTRRDCILIVQRVVIGALCP